MILPLLLAAAQAAPVDAPAPATVPLGADLEHFAYPRELRWFTSGAGLHMAYLDFAARGSGIGRTIVLLHGKNFCAVTWEETARALAAAGYRVIAPDQVGFCKSSKPADFQYSFAALATLTRDLLAHAGAGPVTLVGHSTGGMLAVRMALLYPQTISSLVLVNPLGLNDPVAEGVPYPRSQRCGRRRRRPAPRRSGRTSSAPTTPGSGGRRTSVGCRCSPGSMRLRAATRCGKRRRGCPT